MQYIGYGNGRDTINDGVTASYTPGYGGGNGDTLYLPNVLLSQVYVARQADNLWLSSMADASDGQITEGVVITNFFQGGIYTIEYLRNPRCCHQPVGCFRCSLTLLRASSCLPWPCLHVCTHPLMFNLMEVICKSIAALQLRCPSTVSQAKNPLRVHQKSNNLQRL
ncbi:MAG: hypothetical protein U1E47_03075 [Rivihabitans pingtungensis]